MLEALTFTGIIQAVRGHGAVARTVPLDLASGVDPDAFEAALTTPGAPARLGVVIPDFHNPTGASLSLDKRQRLAVAAARANVPLIEDDPYSLLRGTGQRLPPIKSFDEAGRVFYMGSFSKIIAPAMRLGWIVAPAELLPKLSVLRESLDLELSQLLQRTVTEFASRGYLEPHLAALNAANSTRRAAMCAALERELGGQASWIAPEGGIFRGSAWRRTATPARCWPLLSSIRWPTSPAFTSHPPAAAPIRCGSIIPTTPPSVSMKACGVWRR